MLSNLSSFTALRSKRKFIVFSFLKLSSSQLFEIKSQLRFLQLRHAAKGIFKFMQELLNYKSTIFTA